MRSCILVDIDGTLADCNHRLKDGVLDCHIWKVQTDPVIEPIAGLVRHLSHQHSVFYLTGRRNNLLYPTLNWLKQHRLWFYGAKVYMRDTDDPRKTSEFKRDTWHNLKSRGFKVHLVFEDNKTNIKMWRDEKLLVLAPNGGNHF